MRSQSIHQEAIYYRKKGYSYNMISQKLGLAKSTLSDWLNEIPFTLNKEVIARIGEAKIKSARFKNEQKLKNIKEMRALAIKELGKLSKRDLWLLGLGLYWGEGEKSNESVGLMNSNSEIIKTMIEWFKMVCGANTENFTGTIHGYPDTDIKKETSYWSKVTGIPKNQFKKPQIDKRTNKLKIKKGKLPHGTLKLRIKSNGKKELGRSLHRKITGWIETSYKQTNKRV